MSQKETNHAYEERKKEFLYEINTKGKYHILKEKMKKTIVRIVREHFGKSGQLKGLKRIHAISSTANYMFTLSNKCVRQFLK